MTSGSLRKEWSTSKSIDKGKKEKIYKKKKNWKQIYQ